jgi:predicted TIM-barrel fold metal-dependent hydrolase
MIIDFEHHFSTEHQLQSRGSKSPKIGRWWDQEGNLRIKASMQATIVDSHLKFMDEAGIDMAVLTTNMCLSMEEARHWNDACAKVVKEHPRRFTGFAATMPLGGQPALLELERAVKDLGLKGVHIQARIEGRTLDSRDLWPFYEKVSELGVPVDVHVEPDPTGYDALNSAYALYYVVGREFDICATALRLCLGGVLEAFPDMAFIVNHFGGGVSALKDRVDVYWDLLGDMFYRDSKPLRSRHWSYYVDKLYFNMAGREAGMASVKCALTNISPRKLLFGSDWPWNFEENPRDAKRYIEEIKKLDLPKGDIDAMLGDNAAALLGI